jgi:hypothetical protein
MGGDHFAGERDVGDVPAIAMDSRVERKRAPLEAEMELFDLPPSLSAGG